MPGWLGGARVPLIWLIERQGPTALAVGACGGCLDIFTLIYLGGYIDEPGVRPSSVRPSVNIFVYAQ